jgi:pre-60S factor REI1
MPEEQEQEQQQQQPPQPQQLTSTTAPGKVFGSRAELAAHYQTAWHRYNLKRREAGLPVLLESDFEARWAAAQAVHTERLGKGKAKNKKHNDNDSSVQTTSGTDHLKHGKSRKSTNQATTISSEMNEATPDSAADDPSKPDETAASPSNTVEIDPRQCLFDRHTAVSVESNVARMHRKYGFFIPDREYLTDLEGLIGFCHEKIQLGAVCLYCHRIFRSSRSCQQHMRSKVHTKLRYEAGIDLEDLDVFYDFTEANAAFWNSKPARPMLEQETEGEAVTVSDDDNDELADDANDDDDDDEDHDDEDDWEDVSDDEEGADDDEDENGIDMDDEEQEMYRGYEEEVARMGFNVTVLGELVFPDGRIVGHRGLRRYYKQRAPRKEASPAVAAAQQAAGERLYRGRVYQIGNGSSTSTALVSRGGEDQAKNYALVMAGIAPGTAAGRAGRGLLVPSTANGGTYTQVSVYRYRAAMRKQRRGERAGQLIHQRTATNMNRMDKKANRLMNNVSVAHAAR